MLLEDPYNFLMDSQICLIPVKNLNNNLKTFQNPSRTPKTTLKALDTPSRTTYVLNNPRNLLQTQHNILQDSLIPFRKSWNPLKNWSFSPQLWTLWDVRVNVLFGFKHFKPAYYFILMIHLRPIHSCTSKPSLQQSRWILQFCLCRSRFSVYCKCTGWSFQIGWHKLFFIHVVEQNLSNKQRSFSSFCFSLIICCQPLRCLQTDKLTRLNNSYTVNIFHWHSASELPNTAEVLTCLIRRHFKTQLSDISVCPLKYFCLIIWRWHAGFVYLEIWQFKKVQAEMGLRLKANVPR